MSGSSWQRSSALPVSYFSDLRWWHNLEKQVQSVQTRIVRCSCCCLLLLSVYVMSCIWLILNRLKSMYFFFYYRWLYFQPRVITSKVSIIYYKFFCSKNRSWNLFSYNYITTNAIVVRYLFLILLTGKIVANSKRSVIEVNNCFFIDGESSWAVCQRADQLTPEMGRRNADPQLQPHTDFNQVIKIVIIF